MQKIAIEHKRQLSQLLAEGHKRFGKVAPRRDYRDDDEGGGAGTAELLFETHPLLAEQPVGAASDLTYITTENNHADEKADQRSNEAKNELQQKLAQIHKYGHRHAATLNPLG